MNSLDQNKKNIIDRYYGENTIPSEEIDPNKDFEENLVKSLMKMEIKESGQDELDINIMDIVVKAEKIKLEKISNKEFIRFILLATLMITIFSISVITLGSRFFVGFEIMLLILLPLILIFFVIAPIHRGDVNE